MRDLAIVVVILMSYGVGIFVGCGFDDVHSWCHSGPQYRFVINTVDGEYVIAERFRTHGNCFEFETSLDSRGVWFGGIRSIDIERVGE